MSRIRRHRYPMGRTHQEVGPDEFQRLEAHLGPTWMLMKLETPEMISLGFAISSHELLTTCRLSAELSVTTYAAEIGAEANKESVRALAKDVNFMFAALLVGSLARVSGWPAAVE